LISIRSTNMQIQIIDYGESKLVYPKSLPPYPTDREGIAFMSKLFLSPLLFAEFAAGDKRRFIASWDSAVADEI
jgi:hypothetical protein